MAKKYPKVTLTQSQFDYIKGLTQKESVAMAIEKAFEFIHGKKITEVEHAYCSAEYNTVQYVIRAIVGNYLNRLNIVEG